MLCNSKKQTVKPFDNNRKSNCVHPFQKSEHLIFSSFVTSRMTSIAKRAAYRNQQAGVRCKRWTPFLTRERKTISCNQTEGAIEICPVCSTKKYVKWILKFLLFTTVIRMGATLRESHCGATVIYKSVQDWSDLIISNIPKKQYVPRLGINYSLLTYENQECRSERSGAACKNSNRIGELFPACICKIWGISVAALRLCPVSEQEKQLQ